VIRAARETKDGTRDIDVPDGMIHHWIGTAFVEGARSIRRCRSCRTTIGISRSMPPPLPHRNGSTHDGDRYRFFLRFVMKKVITVVREQRARGALHAGRCPIGRKAGLRARASRKSRIRERPAA
jgi:hypothetical protein